MREFFLEENMSTTLGLDLRTNSIGWALIEDGMKVIKSGVRIFPVGVQTEGTLLKEQSESKPQQRTVHADKSKQDS